MERRSAGHRLSGHDASFLYYERPEAPMAIGAVAVVRGRLDAAGYARWVEARTARVPRMRQIVMPAPLGLGHPTWEVDRDFSIANHVLVHDLPAPGSEDQLRELAGQTISTMLDRRRPLWELHVVRGLEGERTGIVAKVHHCLVDGVGSNELTTSLFEVDPGSAPPAIVEPELEPPPGGASRLVEALRDGAREAAQTWSDSLRLVLEAGRRFDPEAAQETAHTLALSLPDLVLPPRRLPFNRRCCGQRRLAWTQISFAEARAVRSAIGGTVNDVLLTLLAGAVGRYLEHHGESPQRRTMRVMVPVNMRPRGEEAALGNRVSLLPVTVPLGEPNPARRLWEIRDATRRLKLARIAESLDAMASFSWLMPQLLHSALGSLDLEPVPLFNLVCSNTPGPQVPLYVMGHPLESYYAHIPVGYQMGLACAIFSYNQKIAIDFVADTAACPDVDTLRACFEAEFAELKDAAGVASIPDVTLVAPLHRHPSPIRA